ncbi:MAG: 1,2-phenylacetyl-CoA epoxidase subunit PaaC [Caulobacteraceae bacterium]
MADHDAALAEYALRLGDDSLILGQRLSAWCGHAPMLEVDLSLTNLALDLVGQARHFLGHAAELRGLGEDADALAFRRDALDFRNSLMVEQPNGDFARTIARQFLFSAWQEPLFDALSASADPALAAIAKKAVKEVAYHARFAGEWVTRLGDGTEESRRRMVEGLDWMWRFTDELFAADALEAELVARGVAADRAILRTPWDQRVGGVLAEAGLEAPAPRRAVLGGREGRHSEHLGHLLCDLQFLQRAYPGAVW